MTKQQINQKLFSELDFELESMRLSEIFLHLKILVNHSSHHKILNQLDQCSEKKLQLISEFIIRKLSLKKNHEIKHYIGLISLLSFIMVSNGTFKNSLNFQSQFYKNQELYIKKIRQLWNATKGTNAEKDARKLLSTYFFALSSFCENNLKQTGLDLGLMFSRSFINTLLTFEFPDDSMLLRHFRALMLYIYSHRLKNLLNFCFVKSLAFHLPLCSSNKNTQTTILFLLNRLFSNRKLTENCMRKIDFKSLVSLVKEIILLEKNRQISKLCFSLLGKMFEANIELSYGLMTSKELCQLITKLYPQTNQKIKLNSTILSIIYGQSSQEKLKLYSQFSNPCNLSPISLQIIEYLTRFSNLPIYFNLANDGYLGALFQILHSRDVEMERKHQMMRIIDNMIFCSQFINQEFARFLKQQVNLGLETINFNKPLIFKFS